MAAGQHVWRIRTSHSASSSRASVTSCSCGCSPSSPSAYAFLPSSSSNPPPNRAPCICVTLLGQSLSPRSSSLEAHNSTSSKGETSASVRMTTSMDVDLKERQGVGCLSLDDDWLGNVPYLSAGKERGRDKDEGGGPIPCISRKRSRQNGWGVNNSNYAASDTLMVRPQQDAESCKLPDHLIESVLARLPLQSFFRFRAVCSSWNSYLYSNTFLKAYSEAGNRQCTWFLVVTANVGRTGRYGHRVVATYDPEYNNWHRIPLPAPLCDLNPYPTAADGGLVCYFVYENRLRTLFVCNPLTKSLRKLPLVLKCSSHISVLKMAMVDRTTSHYFVFVAGMVPAENGGDSLSMEVYDSMTDSWTKCGIIPAKYPKRKPVFGNGVLYIRCYDQRSLLITYDLNVGVWNRICAPLPPTLGYEELVYYQHHVYLVGVLEENYKIESVCLWELQHKLPYPGYMWKEVDRMPRAMFLEFFCDRAYFECQDDERVLMKCCLYGDLIVLVAFNISHRGPFKLLAYDLHNKVWRSLPDSFLASGCRTHKFIEGINYEPRLDVLA